MEIGSEMANLEKLGRIFLPSGCQDSPCTRDAGSTGGRDLAPSQSLLSNSDWVLVDPPAGRGLRVDSALGEKNTPPPVRNRVNFSRRTF